MTEFVKAWSVTRGYIVHWTSAQISSWKLSLSEEKWCVLVVNISVAYNWNPRFGTWPTKQIYQEERREIKVESSTFDHFYLDEWTTVNRGSNSLAAIHRKILQIGKVNNRCLFLTIVRDEANIKTLVKIFSAEIYRRLSSLTLTKSVTVREKSQL